MNKGEFKVVSDLSNVKDAEVLYKVGDIVRIVTDNGRYVTFSFD